MRTRPFNVGFMGALQTVVDGIKLLTKGVIGSKVKFCSGIFVLLGVLVNWNMNVMWIMCVLSGLGYVFLSGVFYSECMYSIYRGLRAVISMMSYDIILLIVLVVIPNL
jgi:NADH:ubiquinone oxidoreductase subunit H